MHPFIFRRMVGEASPTARPGDVVAVYDKTGQLLGRGLYNPRSQIVVRMLTHGPRCVDTGFWRERLRQAIDLRRRLGLLGEATDACRLVHAEADGLTGLVVERYADVLVLEFFSLGMFQRRRELAGLLAELLGLPTALDRPRHAAADWRVLMRAGEGIERVEGFTVPPAEQSDSRPLIIREHGIRYRVDPAGGHKTGFFCDQRDNRLRFASLCRDAEVLDVCCYSGGFGIAAKVLGAAAAVTAVDLDEAALALARENANLNQVRLSLVHSDAFIYLRQMIANHRQFGAVVVDPPKLALSRSEIEIALKKYHDLNTLALQVVRPGGILVTCSCSGLVSRAAFLDVVRGAVRRAGKSVQVVGHTGAAPDHPVTFECPETEYLKVVWLRVL